MNIELIVIKPRNQKSRNLAKKENIIKEAVSEMKEKGRVNISQLARDFDISYSSCYRILQGWNEYVNEELAKNNI